MPNVQMALGYLTVLTLLHYLPYSPGQSELLAYQIDNTFCLSSSLFKNISFTLTATVHDPILYLPIEVPLFHSFINLFNNYSLRTIFQELL